MSQSTNNGGGSLQCHHPIYSVVGEVSPHEVQGFRWQCVAVCCSVSQCVAVCRSVSVVGEVSPHDVQELSSRSPACFEWRLAALGAIATGHGAASACVAADTRIPSQMFGQPAPQPAVGSANTRQQAPQTASHTHSSASSATSSHSVHGATPVSQPQVHVRASLPANIIVHSWFPPPPAIS